MKYLGIIFITCIGVLSTGCGGTRYAVSGYETIYLQKKGVKLSEIVDEHQAYVRTNGDNNRQEGDPVQFFLLPDTTKESDVTVPVIKISTTENKEGWTLYDNTKCVISSLSTTNMTVELTCSGDDCGLRFEKNTISTIEGDDTLQTFRMVTVPIEKYGNIIQIDGEETECVGISFNGKTYICTNEDWARVYGEIKVKENKNHRDKFKKVKDKKVNRWKWPFDWPKDW